MASNPLFIIPYFFLHFPNELCYGYLRFEGNGKIPFPKVAIAKFVWKMQKKIWYYEKWGGRHASFPPRRSVKSVLCNNLQLTQFGVTFS